ncbi:hypothetical protein UPYG_G00043870 [Umbra pygmaea]|uniref:Uncharacterized protein n=1 Tax=Umbra pygmaea TaxID=75934 RepID=A0ABD0Y651_UMBPY
MSLQQGWTFGPFLGELTRGPLTCLKYAWAVKDNDSYFYVDASDENKSNWMRYVACAACEEEHNLTVFQNRGQIYYRVSQPILEGTELKVWIGQEYAAMLGLGLAEHVKCEFGDKEILLQIFRDIQVVPVGGDNRSETNGSFSWSDNSQTGSPSLVISDVSSGMQADTTDTSFPHTPGQHQNPIHRGPSVNFRYDFVRGSDKLLRPSHPNSPVWEFFGFEPDPNGQLQDKEKVMCKLCGQHVDYSGTNSPLEDHLVQTHHMTRRDVTKEVNKPWACSSRFRPYNNTVGRLLSNDTSTHRTSSNNGDEEWTWTGRPATAGALVAGPAATVQGTQSHFLVSQTTNAISDFLIKDLLPLDTVEGEGFKKLIKTLLPSYKELPSVSLLDAMLKDVHTKQRRIFAKQLMNSTGFSEEDTSNPQLSASSSFTGKSAGSHSQSRGQVPHHVTVSAEFWRHDWQGDNVGWVTLWAHFIDDDFHTYNLALATQCLGDARTSRFYQSVAEDKVMSMAREWGLSRPSFVLLGGEGFGWANPSPIKRERSTERVGEGRGGGAHHPNSTTFLEREDSVSSDDLLLLEQDVKLNNSISGQSHPVSVPCFFTAVRTCVEDIMRHPLISKTLSVYQNVLYSFFSLYDKDTVPLHPAKKLILVLQKQEQMELKAWAYGKLSWNRLYSVVKTLLRYQNMMSEMLKEMSVCSENQITQDRGSQTCLDSGTTTPLEKKDSHDTSTPSATHANSETTDSLNSSVLTLKRSDWKVLEDLVCLLKPLDVACQTLAKEPFPRLSLVKPILTGLVDRHFASRHRNDSAILKELKKKIRLGLANCYDDPQVNLELCLACALDPQFLGLGFMEVKDQMATFAWLKKETVRIAEEDRRRAEVASRGGRKLKRRKRGSSSTTSSSGEMDSEVLRRSKRLKDITPVSFKDMIASESDETAVSDDSDYENMEADGEPASQQTGMEFLLGDLFGSQSQNKQSSVEEQVDVEVSIFRAEKGAALGVEPLQWWNARSGQLPLLATVARVYLAAPAVAGSAAQAFLQDGGALHKKRKNIPPESLDLMLFLNHNSLSLTTQGHTAV